MTVALDSPADAARLLTAAWPAMVSDCRAVLGSELHYQAMIYCALRDAGAPRGQVGMNVKQWITDVVSDRFRALDLRKKDGFRGGFEPIPDIVLFTDRIAGDWRRRNREATLHHALCVIEVKASERAGGRLGRAEILRDIGKLAAHRVEARHRGFDFLPVMLVVDTAPLADERMRPADRVSCRTAAVAGGLGWLYVGPDVDEVILPGGAVSAHTPTST